MNMHRNWRQHGEPRRLQIFVSDLGATGVVRNAIALANEAARSGYRVRLLTCQADGVLRGQIGPAVAVVRLNEPADSQLSRRRQMQRALLAYRRHSRAWRPDLMVSAGNHGHLLSSLAWAGLPGAKLLRFSNDLMHSKPSLIARLWRTARFHLMSGLADCLVYVSRAQAHHPLLAGQLASGKAVTIPNGVDLDHVRRESLQPCDHPWAADPSIPLVLAVGRHVPQKNFATLLRAFAQARAVRPMRLIFLGDGKAAEIARLRDLAGQLGVGGDVDFVAATPNPFPYFAAATTLVLPSLWEGSANVLLETMACGTPVIASRTAGDAAHLLGCDRYGLLVDPRDTGQIAAALLRQVGAAPVRPGERAADFDRKVTLADYMRLFDRLAGAATRGRARQRPASRSPKPSVLAN